MGRGRSNLAPRSVCCLVFNSTTIRYGMHLRIWHGQAPLSCRAGGVRRVEGLPIPCLEHRTLMQPPPGCIVQIVFQSWHGPNGHSPSNVSPHAELPELIVVLTQPFGTLPRTTLAPEPSVASSPPLGRSVALLAAHVPPANHLAGLQDPASTGTTHTEPGPGRPPS